MIIVVKSLSFYDKRFHDIDRDESDGATRDGDVLLFEST